jgi:predicted acetyltransferase
MSLEIREPRDHELDEVAYTVGYAFDGDRSPEALEGYRRLFTVLRPLAAFQDGRVVATLGLLPMAMAVNGGSQPFAGVASVACLPEHRRKGYVGQLLTRALEMMRDEGQVLSGLYTPHFALYRRYGWALARRAVRYSFSPRDIALVASGRPPGEAMRVSEQEWAGLDALYRAFITRRNGYLRRTEQWWRTGVLRNFYERRGSQWDAAVWVTEDNEWRGYVVYEVKNSPDVGHSLRVRDFVALDSDAYVGLVRYLLHHDIASPLQWWAPLDDPFLSLVDDPGRVQVAYEQGMFLRVVDVAGAFAARPCLAEASDESLTLELTDEAAPWNAGCWRLEANAGYTLAQKFEGAPDLSLDVSVLAVLFDGFLCPSEAARGGLLKVHRESALAAAERIFSVICSPFTADYF